MKVLKKIKHFFKNKKWSVKGALVLLCLYLIVAIIAPYIANDRPLRAKLAGESQSIQPILMDDVAAKKIDWAKQEYDEVKWCWIPFSPTVEIENAQYIQPLQKAQHPSKTRHWLGTTSNNKDLASMLIHGTRTALMLGFFTMLIAATLGTYWGILAGMDKSTYYHLNIVQIIVTVISILLLNFEIEQLVKLGYSKALIWWILIFAGLIITILWWLFGKLKMPSFKIKKDNLVLLGIEVVHTLPGLLFIGLISRWNEGGLNIAQFALVLGLLSWPIFARFARSETQQLVKQNFVQSAYAIGLGRFGTLFKYILPNIFMRIALPFVIGFGGVIILEANLSFLGYGLAEDIISWGRTMQIENPNSENWHIVLFPGLCIMGVVLPLSILANNVRKA